MPSNSSRPQLGSIRRFRLDAGHQDRQMIAEFDRGEQSANLRYEQDRGFQTRTGLHSPLRVLGLSISALAARCRCLQGQAATRAWISRGVGGLVDVSDPTAFGGAILDFGVSDQIDLVQTTATSVTYDGSVLTVLNGSQIVASLNVVGDYMASTFTLNGDGHCGTLIGYI